MTAGQREAKEAYSYTENIMAITVRVASVSARLQLPKAATEGPLFALIPKPRSIRRCGMLVSDRRLVYSILCHTTVSTATGACLILVLREGRRPERKLRLLYISWHGSSWDRSTAACGNRTSAL